MEKAELKRIADYVNDLEEGWLCGTKRKPRRTRKIQ